MSSSQGGSRLSLVEFRNQTRHQAQVVAGQIRYVAAGEPLNEEDLRDYIEDPIQALPEAVVKLLPPATILLVPFMERAPGNRNGRQSAVAASDLNVVFERPAEGKAVYATMWTEPSGAVLAFGIDDLEVAAYHHELYHCLSELAVQSVAESDAAEFMGVLREELSSRTHGEVDEGSWQKKEALLRRGTPKKDGKGFVEYSRQAMIDTMTLYLHGICCDIDVEPGPRQLPSRHLRRRLKLLQGMYPPPKGYAVFPEELDLAETEA